MGGSGGSGDAPGRSVARPGSDGAFARFDRIDWTAPWFAQVAQRGARWQRVALEQPADYLVQLRRDARAAGFVTGRGAPLTFIAQAELPAGTAYEAHIAATGGVPTRENLHDFFNALIWFAFPRVKAALNARQADVIERDGIGAERGAERDALTLFDENAVLFVTSDAALRETLVAHDWQTLFVADRPAWGQRCSVLAFGHALLEKLIDPYKACTAHAWLVGAPPEFFGWPARERTAWLDATVAAQLMREPLTPRVFAPLPVLGVPGWWAQNGDSSFYDDERVFRRSRRSARSGR